MKRTFAAMLAALLLLLCLPAAVLAAPASDALTAAEESALEALEQAIGEFRTEADLSAWKLSFDSVSALFDIIYDEPDLFFFDHAVSYGTDSRGVSRVELYYREGMGTAEREAYAAAVEDVLRRTLLPGMDDLQKAIVLHDYLAANVAYDPGEKTGTAAEASYTAYGALVLGVAVCDGYARAYQALLEGCGVPCRTTASEAMVHRWNLVELDGSWYHADVTWDDPRPDRLGRAKHTYFLLSDGEVRERGKKHSGWESSVLCTDTRYDAALWSDMDAPLIFTDADTLWLLRAEGEGQNQVVSLVRRSWSSGGETAVWSFRDTWPVLEEAGSYWVGAFSGLCLWDGRLFFNDSRHILVYDPADGTTEEVFALEGDEGRIYGLRAAEDGVLWLLARSPEDPGQYRKLRPERKHPVNPFADVSESDYFYEAVLWAYENKVTAGTGEDTFSPRDTCTRGQVVTFLWRAMGCPAPAGADNPFADVAEEAWYRDAVLWAVEQGITNGTGADGEGRQLFGPGQTCSYAHILTFLWRTVTGGKDPASDPWYAAALSWAGERGLLEGTAPGADAARVGEDCPRCDVVTYLRRCAS